MAYSACAACAAPAPPPVSKTNNRIPFLDTLRGFAALWVVLFHCAEGKHLPVLTGMLPSWLVDAVFHAGHLGVPIFFVLSGFVLARISAGKIDSGRAAARFIAQRLVRLSPPYYVAVAIGAALMLAKSHAEGGVAPQVTQVIAHLAYSQDILGFDPLSTVFWTLAMEVQFYLAFALLLWAAHGTARRAEVADLNAWFVGVAAAIALLWPLQVVTTAFWRGGFIGLWYSFLCGSMVALARGRLQGRGIAALAHVAAVGVVGVCMGDAFALAAAVAALFIFAAERWAGLARAADLAPLTALGLVSYSLYLFHNPVTGVTARIVRRFMPPGLACELVLLGCVLTTCIAFAAVMYVLVEKPAMRWSHRFARRNDAARPA